VGEKRRLEKEIEKAIFEIAEGNGESLSVIYDNMAQMIFSIALGVTENRADAEDVLQETMIDIVKYSDSYRAGTNPKAWILSMARNNSLDILRKRKNYISLDDETLRYIESNESKEDAERYIASDAAALLSALEEDEREIIILRIYAELSYIDAAKAMGISVFAAQKRYQRAMKKLKSINGGDLG